MKKPSTFVGTQEEFNTARQTALLQADATPKKMTFTTKWKSAL